MATAFLNGFELYYDERGVDPPVVFIHGGFAFLSILVGFSCIPRSKAKIALDEPMVDRKRRLGAKKFYRFLQ